MNHPKPLNSPSDLAFFGARPTFGDVLHVGRPNIGDAATLQQRFDDIVSRRWLTNGGEYVARFEARVAEVAGVEHAVAVANATIGLQLATRALGFTGEVIVPSFSFVATAHAVEWQGLTPVFVDIDPETYNLDPDRVAEHITPRTTGILAVHVYGRPCDVEGLEAVARRHGLRLLFDSAHAFGCSHRGRMIGQFGDAEVFSFHATKFINAGEGGAIVTADGELARRLRSMKNFGFSGYDETEGVGTNGKMSELSAAMGLTNLESMSEFVEHNRAVYEAYVAGLAGIRGIELVRYDESERNNLQYIVIEADPEATGLTRDELMRLLHAENVLARRYFYPGIHQLEPYRSLYPTAGHLLKHTERAAERVLCLPTGTGITLEQVGDLCALIRWMVERGPALAERMRSGAPAPGRSG